MERRVVGGRFKEGEKVEGLRSYLIVHVVLEEEKTVEDFIRSTELAPACTRLIHTQPISIFARVLVPLSREASPAPFIFIQ